MGAKPFVLFGRRSDESTDQTKDFAAIKTESTRLASEAGRRIEQAKKEEQALKALRNEVAARMRLCDQKEAQLRSEDARITKLKKEEQSLRSAVSELDHAYEEKKAALDERQKAIVNLTKDITVLVQKRAEVQRMEASLRNSVLKEREIRQKTEKMERRMAEGQRILEDQERHIEISRRAIEKLQTQLKELTVMKKQFDSQTAEQKKSILSAERKLADMEDAVKTVLDTREEMQKKAAFMVQRDRQLSDQERRIDQKKRELERIKIDAEAVAKDKQHLFALIEDKKHVLEDLKKTITENVETIKELHEQELEARTSANDLIKAQHEQDKKLKLLDTKERELIRKETTFVEHDKALREAARMLEKNKKDLADEVNSRKAELLLLSQEWEKKFTELSEEKQALQGEKADVRKLIDTDVLALKDKEDEMIEAIAMLERDRDKLQVEEKALLKRVVELEHAKAGFEREKNALNSKEKRIIDGERIMQKGMKFIEDENRKIEQAKDIVYRSKELKKSLPKMERKYEELHKGAGKIVAERIERGIRPLAAARAFKEREEELVLRTKGIELETRKLMEREHEVEALESRKERAFSEYLREEVERAAMGKPGREIVNPEIHGMVDDAREKVMQGKLDEAVRLVAEAEYLIDKLQNMNQKRIFMYDIRDLKASIKLATLM